MSDLKPKWVLHVSVVTGMLLGTCVFLAAKITNPPPLNWLDMEFWDRLGMPIPAFELETLDGRFISNQTFNEKGYMLVLGESSCPACDEIYPMLKEVSQKVPVLMVVTGQRTEIMTKAAEHNFSFPIAFDSSAVVAKSLQLRLYPTAILIDKKGNIIKAASGTDYAVQVMQLVQTSPQLVG